MGELKFTPLEFETSVHPVAWLNVRIKIYSVGVWNHYLQNSLKAFDKIKIYSVGVWNHTHATTNPKSPKQLKFTPLEFETSAGIKCNNALNIKIYSVGVWNITSIEVTTESDLIKIYSVGVWNPKTNRGENHNQGD